MTRVFFAWLCACWSMGFSATASADEGAAASDVASGWRGNATGLWPESKAPLAWQRLAHGTLEGLRSQADRPAQDAQQERARVHKGLPPEWLVLGPINVHDSAESFDEDQLGGEDKAEPAAGDAAGDQHWQVLKAPLDDPMVFGTAKMPFVELATEENFVKNRVIYAHAYLFSPRGGPARALVEHCFGLKAWVNGKEVYRHSGRQGGLDTYPGLSRLELEQTESNSGAFDCEFKPGWNRLLLKIISSNHDDWKAMNFLLRFTESPMLSYETKNIRWMSELPNRSTSTPIIVADRIFVMAEPDELLCFEKQSGKKLWTTAINYYEALTPEEKAEHAEYAGRIDPLVANLREVTDRSKRIQLRHDIQAGLLEIDRTKFEMQTDAHFAGHLGIVGFTMASPVSDGRHVYVWNGVGVAACFDLDGKRQWITRVPQIDPIAYGSSPGLADGILAVFAGKLFGLDAQTGEVRWTQARVKHNMAAMLGTRLGGQPALVSYLGEVVRPRDGKLLFRPRGDISSGDTGTWAPPVVLDGTMYVTRYGVFRLAVFDFHEVQGESWLPEQVLNADLEVPAEIHRHPTDGSWLSRSTAGSVLVHDGLSYQVDIYGWLFVADAKTNKLVYIKNLELDGLMHYSPCRWRPVLR